MATEWCVSMASPLTDFTEIAYEGHTHTQMHVTLFLRVLMHGLLLCTHCPG